MSLETLSPPTGELPDHLKTANGFVKPGIKDIFGNPLEPLRSQALDQQIPKPEVLATNAVFKNPRVIELVPAKKVIVPEPISIPEPNPADPILPKNELFIQPSSSKPKAKAKPSETELKNLHPAKEVEGQLFVCDVSLYRNLYNELLEASGGNEEIARRDTYYAILRDGTSLIQENISALKDEKGNRVVDDEIIQAKMQQTPTVHTLKQVKNSNGEDVITSPEYTYLGKSITASITGWRRNNDHAVASLVEDLAINLPELPEGEGYTLGWGSPKAEEWENEWIRKFNGEYGYFYSGFLTGPIRARELIVYSHKVDATTSTYAEFMDSRKGESYTAPFEDQAERPFLDKLMRTVKVSRGAVTVAETNAALYQAKLKAEGSDRMFGILEDTMHYVQDPELRQRIEDEASAPVARWLVDQISKSTSNDIIQAQVRDKYINSVKSLVTVLKSERDLVQIEKSKQSKREDVIQVTPDMISKSPGMSDMEWAFMQDLRKRTQTSGAFCGEWGESKNAFGTDPIQDIIDNYTGLSGGSGGGMFGGGLRLSSGNSETCKTCNKRPAVEGGCGYCDPCASKM